MIFLVLYLIGFVLCGLIFLHEHFKTSYKLTLSELFFGLFFCLFSWFLILVFFIVWYEDNCVEKIDKKVWKFFKDLGDTVVWRQK